MAADPTVRASKFLALILRHKPEVIGLTLDPEGWADIEEIIAKSGGRLTRDIIDWAVAENNKARYAVSEDGLRIRARQGHSVEVDLGLTPREPPAILFHGTHAGMVEVIRREGLKKMARQHVHLSADPETAKSVGGRRGRPVVFIVGARSMHLMGFKFFLSENGVWLTDHVPPGYLREEA
jgi:putative RNA 2'-phosphotransferase